jgi:hypothetical protein
VSDARCWASTAIVAGSAHSMILFALVVDNLVNLLALLLTLKLV